MEKYQQLLTDIDDALEFAKLVKAKWADERVAEWKVEEDMIADFTALLRARLLTTKAIILFGIIRNDDRDKERAAQIKKLQKALCNLNNEIRGKLYNMLKQV